MYDAKIIVPMRFSKWVSNLVPTRKKSWEIRLCIDFRNLNKVSLKENYPLSKEVEASGKEVEDVNIGTEEKPRIVKLSKSLPPEQKLKYIELFKEYADVFAWGYEDLKSYDTSIIQHRIPIKEDQKPFRQKLRRINPKLLPLIEKKIKKMYDAKIIVPMRFSKWVSNLVPTRKKSWEIRLCIDFRNLNKVSLKENYPLSKMDHILQKVVGSI
jgi:hypothetical protein